MAMIEQTLAHSVAITEESKSAHYSMIDQSIIEQYHALRAGKITAVQLCEAYLARIQLQNSQYHAFVEIDAQSALEQAKQVDKQFAEGIDLGLLHGIPFAAKDLFFVDGFQTRCGSKVAVAQQKQADVITALVEAGAICIGKLATYEYATVGPAFDLPYEIVRNPVNPDYVTGGSSSGSAAAVAARMLRFAIGTDTGGSIRSPASYCGVVGLKPTFGSLSAKGVVPLAPSMDVPGIMAATTLEALISIQVMQGKSADELINQINTFNASAMFEGKNRLSGKNCLSGKKVAYARNFFATDPKLDPEILVAIDHAVSVFSLLGAEIHQIDLPEYQPLEDAAAVILHAEAYQYHAERLATEADSYGNLAYNSLLYGNRFDLDAVLAANLVRAQFSAALAEHFSQHQYDAILTVNTLTTAAQIAQCNNDKPVWSPMRTIPFNLSGNPVLALPAGFTAKGLPIGLQLIGDQFAEKTICQLGMAYEAKTVGFWQNEQAYGFGISINNHHSL